MKLVKLTLVAALATVFAAPAFAVDSATIQNATSISNDIKLSGELVVQGLVSATAESAAVTNNNQTSVGDVSNGENQAADPNWSSLDSGAGNNAQGNVSVNVSSGNANGQSNDVALTAVDTASVFASAQTFSTQHSGSADDAGVSVNAYNNTTVSDALQGAKGNVGLNAAAGDLNLQSNQLATSVNSTGALAKATASNDQTLANNITTTNATNIAALGGNALANAQGNIAANITSGIGNLQHNSMAIAVAQR